MNGEEEREQFISKVINLEKLNKEFFQLHKNELEKRLISGVQAIPTVQSDPTDTTSAKSEPILINDYTRVNRMYCIMLWTYWEVLRNSEKANDTSTTKELNLVRNCLVHHDGNVAKHINSSNPKYASQGKELFEIGTPKGYIQEFNLILTESHLDIFTEGVKQAFEGLTGISFPK